MCWRLKCRRATHCRRSQYGTDVRYVHPLLWKEQNATKTVNIVLLPSMNAQVADIKRLNKIERDYEIHAHKTLQVPLTADNILADHLSTVAEDGSSVPATNYHGGDPAAQRNELLLATLDAQAAAAASAETGEVSSEPTINDIILNTKIEPNLPYSDHQDGDESVLGIFSTPIIISDTLTSEHA